MTELPWFPLYARDWLAGEGTSMMLPEQEGPFIRLLCIAWGDGTAEPSLPDDDAALATMTRLGARWKKHGALVRAQFTARDGRLYNAKLSNVWTEQRARSAKLAENGRKGGRAKAGLKPGLSDEQAKPKHTETEAEAESETASSSAPREGGDMQQHAADAMRDLSNRLAGVPGATAALTGFMEGLPTATKRLSWARNLVTSLEPIGGGKAVSPSALVAAMTDFALADRNAFPYTGIMFRSFADRAMRDLDSPTPPRVRRGATGGETDPTVVALEQWKRETDEREAREKAHA